MQGWARAGWGGAGAAGEGGTRWEAPVGALEQDLRPQTAKEVVDKDGAPEKGLGVVDEPHLLQRKAQHVGALLQKGCNLMLGNRPTKVTSLHVRMH